MPQIVGETGCVDDVGITSQRLAEGAPHLCHLEGVGEPGSYEIVSGRPQDLGLGAEAPQRGGVQNSSPIALERCALRILRLLVNKALSVLGSVSGWAETTVSVDTHRLGLGFLH